MIELTLLESTNQIISGIPEYLEFETDVPANIFYTLDGTDPTTGSLIALGKVYLPTSGLSITVKAIAISAGDSSAILTQEYSSDSTKLDGPRNVGEGISVLPYGSNSTNNLSYDAYGDSAQESSTEFVELDMKASLDGNSKETSLSFVNFATTERTDDRFSSSTVNNNIYFDPSAKLVIIDGTSQAKLDEQSVKLINRTYNCFDPTSDFYTERLGQKEPLITGNYVKSFYNPVTNEYISYYYESLDSRWIISKQKIDDVEANRSPAYSKKGKFVYKWIDERGPSTAFSSAVAILVKSK